MTHWYDTLWQHDHLAFHWIAVLVLTGAATITDLKTQRIPNLLTGLGFLAGITAAAVAGGLAGLADGLLGALLAMAPFALLFVFAGGGAGDAKLMAAVGAWTGIFGGLIAVVAVLIAGGLVGISYALARGQGQAVMGNFIWIVTSLRTAVAGRGDARHSTTLPATQHLHTMPYGLSIFLGCLAAFGVILRWHGTI